MARRTSLPGAAELFRATAPAAVPSEQTVPARPLTPVATPSVSSISVDEPEEIADFGATQRAEAPVEIDGRQHAGRRVGSEVGAARSKAPVRTTRRARVDAERAPSGRERHDEKITVYCSPEELLDLESARLHLRAEHGLAVDRGRVVREALAVVLADFEAKGESSILVRRLRGA